MEPMIEVVMTRVTTGSGESSGWYTFNYTNDEGYITSSVMLHKDVWEGLGRPDTITAMVVSGITTEGS